MRFGPVAVREAAGTVLAHTLRLPGRVLRKGNVLSEDDVATLVAAGLTWVVAMRLEEGDLGEDVAAAAVGRTVAGDGLRVNDAFTGRCNLVAAARGLLVVDRDAVDRVNAVDESVTLATAAPFTLLSPGDLAATVKVIPFAVPGAVVERCLAAVAGAPPVRIAPLVPRAAGVVLTRLPGVAEALLDAWLRTVRGRLARLGGGIAAERRVPHEEGAVAAAIGELVAAGHAPILLLGATATVDRADVIPRAIERAGGVVERFGMPVDPGNLLVLGRHGEVPVVGVPGCARSPLTSGFDAVLERLAAGLPVTGDAIARMGVGGLLKEIPTRPQRRASPASDPTPARPRIAAVVLAAGRSRRMEGPNKLIADVGGAPMIARVVDTLLSTPLRPVVVVLGHEAERVRDALPGRGVRFVVNPDAAEGMSTSLRAGLDALEGVDAALVCLGDMPWVRPAHVEALCAAFDPMEGRAICVPFHEGKRGNPVLWAARYFDEMRALSGDTGARELLERHGDAVWSVPVDDAGVTLDVDTREALQRLTRRPA